MVSEKHGKRYTARFKFQVVMEILVGARIRVLIAPRPPCRALKTGGWVYPEVGRDRRSCSPGQEVES